MIYVVGSGPAGVSCAKALLEQGAQVTMLDSGLELEPERRDRVVQLKNTTLEKWQPDDLAFLKEATSAGVSGIPLKYAYGSDFPYRDPGVDWRLDLDGVDTRPSFAKGGLSTVWGAAVLPYRADDIRDWPVEEAELARHYRAVLDFMPLAGGRDALERLFPLHTDAPQPMSLSSQAKEFLTDLTAAASELTQDGVSCGSARLAMWSGSANGERAGCCSCGLCMYGCPYGVIYSSADTLAALRAHPNFTYRHGIVVDRVVESGPRVTLFARDVIRQDAVRLEGSRAFLACGPLSTTKILLESLEAFDEPVTLKDSSYFLLPLLRFRRTAGVSRERLHTLAQLFMEIVDPQICDQTVHLQIYAYNELYSVALQKLFGPMARLFERPASMLLERLLLVQGYLPSACSAAIRVSLQRESAQRPATLHLSPVSNERAKPVLKRVVRKLRRNTRHLRAIPLEPMLRPGKPGRSFHSGGTFPMQSSPGRLQSDRYGRPSGFTRVHAVDSTVFPSIPATTITFSVMANAHRIGSAVREY
jgi:choline dehydrogenase-like flavoprotein